jgi:predicted transcriptional regulator
MPQMLVLVFCMGGRRRGEVEIIRDVLEVCLGGASKTRIVYRANLNFSRLDRYLGLLLGLGFLAAEDDGSGGVVYRTTGAGRDFLNGCLRVEGGLEKRVVKVKA